MKRRTPCVLCAATLSALAAIAPAQAVAKSHDALATPRSKAASENQRVLLYLTGGKAETDKALAAAMNNYGTLGKLLRYEYQLSAIPARSVAGSALRKQLGMEDVELPALVALTSKDKPLGQLTASQMFRDGRFSSKTVRAFLESHKCSPKNAREVLTEGQSRAKKNKRDLFVYLSAPW